MSETVICRSCGYIMKKSRLKSLCPACGVPSRLFESYVDPLSSRRRLLLRLDIHPVLAHFPQAFTFSALILCIAARYLSGLWLAKILACLEILCITLPFVGMLTFAAGLFDGRVRFRRIVTPLLVRKMIVGGLFLLLSLAIALLTVSHSPLAQPLLNAVTLLVTAAFVCSAMLGWIGTGLLNSKFPG